MIGRTTDAILRSAPLTLGMMLIVAVGSGLAAKRVLIDGTTVWGSVPRQLTGRARATALGQQLGRAIGARDAYNIDFERWHDYVPLGDYALEYHPERDVLSVRSFMVKMYLDDAKPDERRKVALSNAGLNDPAAGGMFERGGGYYVADSSRDEGYLVHDYPVAAMSARALREGFEDHVNVAATWRLRWGPQVFGIVHHFTDTKPVVGPVIWDDERHALAADVSRLRGRDRADALVRAYLAHRLVKGASLDRDGRYDAGDFYLHYDADADALEAGVFVTTPADLARLAAAGLPAGRLVPALDALIQRCVFASPPPNAPGAGPDPGRSGPVLRGGPARLRIVAPAEARGTPPERMLYLVQRWPARALTPTALDLAMEQLLDYGAVWRHRWLWRAARMALGTERPPARPLARTPDDYGFDPAAERLDAPPPAAP